MTIKLRALALAGLTLAFAGLTTGCATRGYVRDRIEEQTTRIDQRLDAVDSQMATLQNSTEEASQRAALASSEAGEARQLALGRHGYQEVERRVVYFDFDSDELTDAARGELDNLAGRIRGEPDLLVDIYGYADPRGSARYNRDLGQRRAESALRYMLDRAPGELRRFAAVSYGEFAAGDAEFSQERRAVVALIRRTPLPGSTQDQPVVSEQLIRRRD